MSSRSNGDMNCIDISIVSYASSHVTNYATYSFFMLTEYANYRDYKINLLSWLDSEHYDMSDHRWNKVKILLESMRNRSSTMGTLPFEHGSAQNENVATCGHYYVWADADLIVTNFSFSFVELIRQYPDRDLIISSDQDVRNGIVNSGCMVIRDSAWSRVFLERWWSDFSHSAGSDQLAFTKLYRLLLQEAAPESGAAESGRGVAAHIEILPAHVLNSRIPAWQRQQDGDSVLHLAGEAAGLRTLVFRHARDAFLAKAGSGGAGEAVAAELRRPAGEAWWGLSRARLRELYVEYAATHRLRALEELRLQSEALEAELGVASVPAQEPRSDLEEVWERARAGAGRVRSAVRDAMQANRVFLQQSQSRVDLRRADLAAGGSLRAVYSVLRRLHSQPPMGNNSGVCAAVQRGVRLGAVVAMTQDVLDTGFELATVLMTLAETEPVPGTLKEEYLPPADPLEAAARGSPVSQCCRRNALRCTEGHSAALVVQLMSELDADINFLLQCVSLRPDHRKVIAYYRYKQCEFESDGYRSLLMLQGGHGQDTDTDTDTDMGAVSASVLGFGDEECLLPDLFTRALRAAAREWYVELHLRLGYYGSGNGLTGTDWNAMNEGVAVTRRLGKWLCQRPSVSGDEALLWLNRSVSLCAEMMLTTAAYVSPPPLGNTLEGGVSPDTGAGGEGRDVDREVVQSLFESYGAALHCAVRVRYTPVTVTVTGEQRYSIAEVCSSFVRDWIRIDRAQPRVLAFVHHEKQFRLWHHLCRGVARWDAWFDFEAALLRTQNTLTPVDSADSVIHQSVTWKRKKKKKKKKQKK